MELTELHDLDLSIAVVNIYVIFFYNILTLPNISQTCPKTSIVLLFVLFNQNIR